MRRQQQRSQHHERSGYGGAWAGSDSDSGDKWGRRTEGAGNTAWDYVQKQFQKNFEFSFEFPFGDFFNNGFDEAPVADNSDRMSDTSYFHKWFPQVN